MFYDVMLGNHSCHNHSLCTFGSMDCETEVINALVTEVPDNHLRAAVAASISIRILEVVV